MMDLRKVAKNFKAGEKFAFGTDPKNVAAMLRELADKLEAGAVVPQTVIHQQHAVLDDFTGDMLLIGYVEKLPEKPGEVRELYGASNLPVAVATTGG